MAPDNYIIKSPIRKFHEYDDFENDFFKCFSSENDNKTFESFNSCFNIKEKDEFLYREINYTKLSNEIKHNNLIQEKLLEEKNEIKFISDKEIKKMMKLLTMNLKIKESIIKIKRRKKNRTKRKKQFLIVFVGRILIQRKIIIFIIKIFILTLNLINVIFVKFLFHIEMEKYIMNEYIILLFSRMYVKKKIVKNLLLLIQL